MRARPAPLLSAKSGSCANLHCQLLFRHDPSPSPGPSRAHPSWTVLELFTQPSFLSVFSSLRADSCCRIAELYAMRPRWPVACRAALLLLRAAVQSSSSNLVASSSSVRVAPPAVISSFCSMESRGRVVLNQPRLRSVNPSFSFWGS